MKVLLVYVSILLLWLSALQAAPSLVELDSGEQIIGEVLSGSDAQTVVLRSSLLGELKVPRAHVTSIQTQTKAAESEAPEKFQMRAQAEGKPGPKEADVKPDERPSAQVSTKKAVADAVATAEEQEILDRIKGFKAPDDWSGNVRLGVNLSQGDSKWVQSYAQVKLEIDPKQSQNYYLFTGSYTYRETERTTGVKYKSTDKYDAGFTYRRKYGDEWFVQNALAYRADMLKDIECEAQETVGVGYHYKPSDSFEVIFGGGGGVEQFEGDYEENQEGLSPVANIFQEATWKPLKRTSIVQKFNYYWNPEDSERYNYVFSAAVRVRLTDLLGFEFSFSQSFDNDVGDGSAQDDTQWRNALVVYF
jgi:putative salt-induced outer membrane protein YdiY